MFWSEFSSLTGGFFFFWGGSGCRLCLLLRGGFGHVSNLAPALVLPRPLPCVLGWLWGLGSVFSSTLETSFVESLAPSPFRQEVQDPSCWIPFSLPPWVLFSLCVDDLVTNSTPATPCPSRSAGSGRTPASVNEVREPGGPCAYPIVSGESPLPTRRSVGFLL